jgi:hypothetical protein
MFGMSDRDMKIRKKSLSFLDEYTLNLDEGKLSDEDVRDFFNKKDFN